MASPFLSPPLFPRSPLFTPIPELDDMEEEEDEEEAGGGVVDAPKPPATPTTARPTATPTGKQPPGSPSRAVICTNCRPSTREKKATSVVPLADPSSSPGVLKSLLTSLTRRTPQRDTAEWRRAAAELSRKLVHATRRRDEALQETSALRRHAAELERKLSRLESHCAALRSSIPDGSPGREPHPALGPALPLDAFLRAVSDARAAVRQLARALAGEMRRAAGPPRAMLRAGAAFRGAAGPRAGALLHVESLLNRVFHEDFETAAFERGAPEPVLDPFERAESNHAAYESLKGLTWEEVLSKGTRHYSEGLSRFCDRKMSEVVAILEWVRAWPEPLLQAFFGAAKAVWLAHLLAWSVHPAIPQFRVGAGARFDPAYMEDVAIDRPPAGSTGAVQVMVAPGFYVYSSVVKCRVLCSYSDGHVERRREQLGM